jgi:hypothetical protein
VKGKEDKNNVAKNTVKKEEKKNVPPTETKPVQKDTDLNCYYNNFDCCK